MLLQAYIHFYGFQDTAAAASSYRRVGTRNQGPCHDLALEGLKHCPVSEREAMPASRPLSQPKPKNQQTKTAAPGNAMAG